VTIKSSLAVMLGCFFVGPGSWGQEVIGQREASKVQAVEKADGAGESGSSAVPVWTEEQTPVDFLEAVGLVAKARWRQLYRPPPTTPSPDRTRTAVTLGFLVGESYLCVQAADAQQFRNNNQEVMTYCRTLGFGEKVSPMLLGQAKLAEMEQWTELKGNGIEGYQALEQSLMDQRDEDLAVLLKLGVWLRTLEIVSSVVLDSPEADFKKLCVGSPALIEELRGAYAQMPESVREGDVGKEVGHLLDFLWRNWGRPDLVEPSTEVVQKTHERLAQSARKLSLK
jgi:hypothetical protein